ncbi:hypothetical protein PR202_gb01397 [Eleusine coracana subsp. coracana]|uniref:Demeter RRM-fold domain-containing protein n=1 Tax=Eleusine coracana subsp. coracana TaxID=191504 RepID=A0AAV5DW04_ELECO|nr:hypothetical protein PR202_gb01397 [Eleusine coracana subsp. coracana]
MGALILSGYEIFPQTQQTIPSWRPYKSICGLAYVSLINKHCEYELHYHMITFGKDKSLVKSSDQFPFQSSSMQPQSSSHLPRLEGNIHARDFIPENPEPIIEEPASPREEECPETMENDIEDFDEDGEIPTIKLNMEAFAQNLEHCIKESNKELQSDDIAKALVTISSEAASIPLPKLKNVHRLRTEHYVYELPDSHPLVQQVPCRTAMRGSFPLNGTYFQVNEVLSNI